EHVFYLDDRDVRLSGDAMDGVAELGDVARPGERAEQRERGLREASRGRSRRRTVVQQSLREQRHVLGAIAQRRQIDARRRQSAVEIAAEAMRVYVRVEAG